MARRSRGIGVVVCVLAAQHVAAQDAFEKTFATDALWSGIKKDVHSHLQRMLQIESEHPKEPVNPEESCSPAALARDKKSIATPITEFKLATKPVNKSSPRTTSPAPNCEGPHCLVAPKPSSKTESGGKSSSSELQAPPQKIVTYGPMTQGAFERMVQRKRSLLREELQKAGTLTAELDAFLKTSDGHVKDAFGIPLPAAPKTPEPGADFEMRFAPQAPAVDPATAGRSTTITTVTSSDATAAAATGTGADADAAIGKIAPTSLHDFEMRFEPQTPAPDPNLIGKELEAFMAASPAGVTTRTSSVQTGASASDTHSDVSSAMAHVSPKREAVNIERRVTAQSGGSGPTLPPMGEQEAARLAAQQAANAAAREAALARKREMARDEQEAAAKRASDSNSTFATSTATSTINPAAKVTAASVLRSAATPQPQPQDPRTVGSKPTITSANVRRVKRSPSSTTSRRGALGYLLAVSLLAASAMVLFVAAAAEFIIRERNTNGGDWLVLTRGLWRRCRRAFSAARKQLTGHGSDLPLSANEGTGPLARAVAAASAFVHVFWSHLADHRGQHIGGAVTAALDASRRASAGGALSDSASAGGAFHGSQRQQPYYGSSYAITADTSAAATAASELNIRRRH